MPFNKLDESTIGKIRPRFKLQTPEKKEAVMALIKSFETNDETIIGNHYDRSIRLSIPKKDQHYWSPVLNLTFEQEEDKCIIRCQIGPKETVWQMIMMLYIGFSVLSFFGSMFALVKWQLNGTTSFLFILPLSLVILGSIFIISTVGKTKGHTQMLHLLRFLRNSVDSIQCERVHEDMKDAF